MKNTPESIRQRFSSSASQAPDQNGFTLVELSIVLVIIGLIIGGILVGRDLIETATTRAAIAQIDSLMAATNTFRAKYGQLPGDIDAINASEAGFKPRGTEQGRGDGNGLLEGRYQSVGLSGQIEDGGETVMFWVDLSTAGLINANLMAATATEDINASNPVTATSSPTTLDMVFPKSKIGNGNYIYAWSGGWKGASDLFHGDNQNWFGISAITSVMEWMNSDPGLTVQQAYSIDKKIDDGLPQYGSVIAAYLDNTTPYFGTVKWSGGKNASGDFDPDTLGPVVDGDGVATLPLETTCYDNGGVGGAVENYSLSQNNASATNCGISIRFQ